MTLPVGVLSGKSNITIQQGSTFEKVYTLVGTDISAFTSRMQIRETIEATTVVLDSAAGDITITLVLNGSDTDITVSITEVKTAALTIASGVYDLEVIDGSSNVFRIIGGEVAISKEVTR